MEGRGRQGGRRSRRTWRGVKDIYHGNSLSAGDGSLTISHVIREGDSQMNGGWRGSRGWRGVRGSVGRREAVTAWWVWAGGLG